MPVAEMTMPKEVHRSRPADALTFLRNAREMLRGPRVSPVEIDQTLQVLEEALDQVLDEHGGLAEELLSAYEQLGIVFDVTRRLAGVQTEEEVVGLFLDSLKRTFAGRRVFAASRCSTGGWTHGRELIKEPLATWIRRACDAKQVIVEPVDEKGPSPHRSDVNVEFAGPPVQALIGPIVCGDTVTRAIVLLRSAEGLPFRRVDMLLLESLTTFCGDLIRNQQLMRELGELSVAMVRSLVSAVDQKDSYTCGHSLRVAYFAMQLGTRIGLQGRDLQMLQWSALLHDVGKIGIRDAILNKSGKLTQEEFDQMKEHPVRSHQVVVDVPQLHEALDGILYHHEHYDGSGYPEGRVGEDIPLQARIIQIADVFDALTSDRSYRPGYDWRKALSIMRDEAGRTIDPYLQTVFDQLIRSRLEGDETAWRRLVEEASVYTRDDASLRLGCGIALAELERANP